MLSKCYVCGDSFEKQIYGFSKESNNDICPDCRPVYIRAKSIEYSSGMPVDVLYIKSLLNQEKCFYCGRKDIDKEIEHKIPLSRGGTNDNSNLCLSCAACNHDKGDMTSEEYAEYKKVDPRLPQLGIRQKVLEHLSQYDLTKITKTSTLKTRKEYYDPPILVNKIKRDKNGNVVGIQKTVVKYNVISETEITEKEELTEYGRIYNTICRLGNKKRLKLKKVKKIIAEEIISSS